MSAFQKILLKQLVPGEARRAMAEARKRRKPVGVLVEVLLTEQTGHPGPGRARTEHRDREDGAIDSVVALLLQRAEGSVGIVAEAGEKCICPGFRKWRMSSRWACLRTELLLSQLRSAPAPAPPPLPAPAAPAGHDMPRRPDGASDLQHEVFIKREFQVPGARGGGKNVPMMSTASCCSD